MHKSCNEVVSMFSLVTGLMMMASLVVPGYKNIPYKQTLSTFVLPHLYG